jgi:acyl-CoA synthetase (NDP forming)
VVLFGLGGSAVELLGDHQVGLAPLSEEDAREMVLGLRAARLLTGYRGARPVDLDALVELVLRMSRLAEDLPEVAEAECNPAIAAPSGVVVVDARLRVAPSMPPPLDDRRRLR